MRKALLPVTVATLLMVAIQLSIFSIWRFAGVVVMVVWLWPLAIGLTGLTALAMWSAMVAGVFFDTHSTTPFGLTALVAMPSPMARRVSGAKESATSTRPRGG